MANHRDKMVSMMDKRMELWLMESAEEFAGLALRCSDDSPKMRRVMAEVVKELQENHTNQPTNINAFDIIALSTGFDLAGLFGDVYNKRESRFTSQKPASVIVSKLEEVAQQLKLSIRKREAGLFKLERLKEGRKGILSMDAEIFQVTPTFHLVEVKKSNGDTLEYQKLVTDDLRPALADIVWVWQGEKDEQSPPQPDSQLETEQQEEPL